MVLLLGLVGVSLFMSKSSPPAGELIVACDAGMGSSVMLASTLKKQLAKNGVTVEHSPVANIPGLPPASEHDAQQHAPHLGENGPAILEELGYSANEIDAIFARGGVRAPAPVAKAAD